MSGVARAPAKSREAARRLERAYAALWASLHRGDDPDLSQHERQLLHHVPAEGGTPLSALAAHLALPKSTASVVVKDLERRGFLRRRRDPADERRLAIVLTPKGRDRVAADTVLDLDGLAAALDRLGDAQTTRLLSALDELVGLLAAE